MKKVGRIIGNIAITIVLVFAILMTVIVLTSTKSEAGIPNLFGKAIFNVETDSMKGEAGFDAGSLIIVELLNEEQSNNLKVGDVITFWRVVDGQKFLETHRIVPDTKTPNQNEVVDGIWIHGGTPAYVTKGDNENDIDFLQDLSGPDYAVADSIVGKWTGTAVPGLGTVMKFLRSQLGFMICVVIPIAIFFVWQFYRFIAVVMENKKQKAVAAVSEAEDDIKQKAIAEYLAQQEAAKAAAAAQQEAEAKDAEPAAQPEQQTPPEE